jgi:hypothetical protein
MLSSHLRGVLAALAFVLSPLAGAAAAPQALGVVATGEARPMVCADGKCAAYLSAFCIQRAREAPATGTAYSPAVGEGGIALVVTAADGTTQRVAANVLRFESLGGFSSVRASVPEAVLRKLGAVGAGIEVGARAVLIPEPVPGDPDPLTEQEVALAAGPLRAAAHDLFDRPGNPRADAARLISRLINALPEQRPPGPTQRDGLWRRHVDAQALEGIEPAAARRAQMAYGACYWQSEHGYGKGLRGCLRATHDAFMMDVNQDYWDRLGGV